MSKPSDRIRARLAAAGERFRANDNIARFIEPGELEALTDEVAERVGDLLRSLVIDTENEMLLTVNKANGVWCVSR